MTVIISKPSFIWITSYRHHTDSEM